jgi:hypothetical protein
MRLVSKCVVLPLAAIARAERRTQARSSLPGSVGVATRQRSDESQGGRMRSGLLAIIVDLSPTWASIDKLHFELLMKCVRNTTEHRQGMPLVIGAFQSRDHGLPGPDKMGQLLLGHCGGHARVVDHLRDAEIDPSVGDLLAKLRIVAGDSIEKFQPVPS